MRRYCLFWAAAGSALAGPCLDFAPVVEQLRARNGAAAATLLRPAAESCRSDGDWHYLMARSHWLLHEMPHAQGMLARALELRGSDPEYHRFAANLYAKAGNFETARLHVEQMLGAAGPAARSRIDLLLAAVLAQNGKARAALAIAERVLAADGSNLDALYYRGLFEQAVGEDDAATRTFEQLLSLQPAHPEARRQLAAVHIEAGRAARALPLLENHPARGKSAELSFLLSRAYFQSRQLDDARGLAEEATRLSPAEPRYWRQLGVVLLRAKDNDGGREAMRKAERLERGATD